MRRNDTGEKTYVSADELEVPKNNNVDFTGICALYSFVLNRTKTDYKDIKLLRSKIIPNRCASIVKPTQH